MGTGSSKNTNDDVVAFEVDDDEEKKNETDHNSNSRKGVLQAVGVKKDQHKKSRNPLGALFSQATVVNPKVALQSRTRIVDFDSSSDEDDVQGGGWEEDVASLQHQLDSLGLDSRRQVRMRDEPVVPRAALVSADSAGPLQDRLGSRRGRGRPPSRDIRFSWEEREPVGEDWTVQKVKIDGFDPEKFRAANKRMEDDSSIVMSHQLQPNRTTYSLMPMPGSVPSYDSMPGVVPSYDPLEQQLLASIERELGVL